MFHTTGPLFVLTTLAVIARGRLIFDGLPICKYPEDDTYENGPGTWLDRCEGGSADVAGLHCECENGALVCPGDTDGQASDIEYCKLYCKCNVPDDEIDQNDPTNDNLINEPPTGDTMPTSPFETCPAKCKSLDDCGTGCKCMSTIWSTIFWFSAKCGQAATPFHNGLRAHDASRKRGSLSGRQITVSNQTGVLGTLQAYACNESYVSLACGDAMDGIVHEPLSNWLGAIVPDGSDPKNPPPIPQEWLSAHNEIQSNPGETS